MRPGYLAGVDNYWFSNLGGDYFEMLDPFSADPTITINDQYQVYGKTAEELTALGPRGWSRLNIVKPTTSSGYRNFPYWGPDSQGSWDNIVTQNQQASQIFKLVS